jgi:hypothetical protein
MVDRNQKKRFRSLKLIDHLIMTSFTCTCIALQLSASSAKLSPKRKRSHLMEQTYAGYKFTPGKTNLKK